MKSVLLGLLLLLSTQAFSQNKTASTALIFKQSVVYDACYQGSLGEASKTYVSYNWEFLGEGVKLRTKGIASLERKKYQFFKYVGKNKNYAKRN